MTMKRREEEDDDDDEEEEEEEDAEEMDEDFPQFHPRQLTDMPRVMMQHFMVKIQRPAKVSNEVMRKNPHQVVEEAKSRENPNVVPYTASSSSSSRSRQRGKSDTEDLEDDEEDVENDDEREGSPNSASVDETTSGPTLDSLLESFDGTIASLEGRAPREASEHVRLSGLCRAHIQRSATEDARQMAQKEIRFSQICSDDCSRRGDSSSAPSSSSSSSSLSSRRGRKRTTVEEDAGESEKTGENKNHDDGGGGGREMDVDLPSGRNREKRGPYGATDAALDDARTRVVGRRGKRKRPGHQSGDNDDDDNDDNDDDDSSRAQLTGGAEGNEKGSVENRRHRSREASGDANGRRRGGSGSGDQSALPRGEAFEERRADRCGRRRIHSFTEGPCGGGGGGGGGGASATTATAKTKTTTTTTWR